MIRTKVILYPVVILLMVVVPVLRYYSSTPGINACVLDYVDNLENSDYAGYMYDINGVKHIEPGNSKLAPRLTEFEVGRTRGCIMASNNLFTDLNNTFYCTITYIIRNAPIDDKYKQPLEFLKTE